MTISNKNVPTPRPGANIAIMVTNEEFKLIEEVRNLDDDVLLPCGHGLFGKCNQCIDESWVIGQKNGKKDGLDIAINLVNKKVSYAFIIEHEEEANSFKRISKAIKAAKDELP